MSVGTLRYKNGDVGIPGNNVRTPSHNHFLWQNYLTDPTARKIVVDGFKLPENRLLQLNYLIGLFANALLKASFVDKDIALLAARGAVGPGLGYLTTLSTADVLQTIRIRFTEALRDIFDLLTSDIPGEEPPSISTERPVPIENSITPYNGVVPDSVFDGFELLESDARQLLDKRFETGVADAVDKALHQLALDILQRSLLSHPSFKHDMESASRRMKRGDYEGYSTLDVGNLIGKFKDSIASCLTSFFVTLPDGTRNRVVNNLCNGAEGEAAPAMQA